MRLGERLAAKRRDKGTPCLWAVQSGVCARAVVITNGAAATAPEEKRIHAGSSSGSSASVKLIQWMDAAPRDSVVPAILRARTFPAPSAATRPQTAAAVSVPTSGAVTSRCWYSS